MKGPRRLRGLGATLFLCLLCLWAAGGLRAQESEDSLADQVTADLAAGRLAAALEKAQIAVGKYPKSSHLQQLRGVVLFKKGMNEDARAAFRHAIAYDPSEPQNYFDLALVDLAEKRYPDASQALETYLHLAPRNAQAHLLLGRAYHNQNQTAPAIEQFKKALALNPALPLAHYHLGFAYQSMGNLPSALEQFYLEIQINPDFPTAHWLAGNIELEHGKLPEAEKQFQEATRLNPQAYQPHYGLARIYAARKQFPEAQAEFRAALKSDPDNVEVHYALARLYQQMGNKDAAAREFTVCATLHTRQEKQLSGIAGASLPP
ncbi:MAG TPA: tetratricopeptide repeat protein [Terriglobia bacterium]|nr:tetratricopeptide repeat protein [Terriglobia bacterium]